MMKVDSSTQGKPWAKLDIINFMVFLFPGHSSYGQSWEGVATGEGYEDPQSLQGKTQLDLDPVFG